MDELRASGVLQRARLQNVEKGDWRVVLGFADNVSFGMCGFELRSAETIHCLVYILDVKSEFCEYIYFDSRYKSMSAAGVTEGWEPFRPYDDKTCRNKSTFSFLLSNTFTVLTRNPHS